MSKITDRTLQTLKGNGRDYAKPIGDSLYMRVSRSGARSFCYRYRNREQRDVWLAIGSYGSLPGEVSLAEARRQAAEWNAARKEGRDPAETLVAAKRVHEQAIAEARAAEQQLQARPTVRQLFAEWHRKELCRRKDRGAEVQRTFEKDVFPRIGDIPAEDVTRRQIMAIVDTVLERGRNYLAKRTVADLRQMYGFAIEREIVDADPTLRIAKKKIGGESVERDRVLSQDEIRELAGKLPDSGLLFTAQAAFWIMLSTCCRIGEISKARWTDLDLAEGIWTIPAENSKNGRRHLLHLSPFAKRQFETLHNLASSEIWMFPNRDDSSFVSTKTLQKQFKDRQRTVPFQNRSKKAGTLMLASGEWWAHDLRRTGATLMGELGVRSDVIERVLNHIESKGVVRVYQRQELMAERKQALLLLGERLELLVRAPTAPRKIAAKLTATSVQRSMGFQTSPAHGRAARVSG